VADALGMDPADVVVVAPDTDVAAYDAGAQGSRTLFSAGAACLAAADDVRRQVLEAAAQMLEASPEDLRLAGGGVEVAGAPSRRVSMAAVAQTALWGSGPIVGRGRHISPPAPVDLSCMAGAFFTSLNAVTWHVHLAEVEVDPDTGHVRILRYVVAQDVGRAINPDAIRSQIQGSVAQGVGYALYEAIRLRDGVPLERDLESYRVPTALDVPDVEAILMEHPAPDGPYGAKGAAEPAIVPVAAALANAVSDAIGRPVTRLPMTPIEILRLLRSESGQRDEVART
jgi:CO/xanthine dehydrogenase Mo-binding subunit